MTGGSFFTGCGGFDLGMEQAGIEIKWQVEKDYHCLTLLNKKFPNIIKRRDITNYMEMSDLGAVDIIFGGDPCPCRSSARGGRKSIHPDLSGWFLYVVRRYSPRWVVRENVCAPDFKWFAAGLELLGYGTVVIELDARDFTSQSRQRQFIIGCPGERAPEFKRAVLKASSDIGFTNTAQEKKETTRCLTANWYRMENSLCYEHGRGLRHLTCEEREALVGLPRGWTDGFSKTRHAIMLGNACPVPMAKWIGEIIKEVDNGPHAT